MEWTVEVDAARGFVRITTRGLFSVDGHARMIGDVLSRPYWRPGMATLFDHRELDMSAATLETMRRAGANHIREDERIGDGLAAIVMARPSDYGTARQFQALVEDDTQAHLRIFLDPAEAERWLTRSGNGQSE